MIVMKTEKSETKKRGKRRATKEKLENIALDWRRYHKNGDMDARKRLIVAYFPLVLNIAGRMAIGFPRSIELKDLINSGVIGLIESFRNFDPDRGVKFETYAIPRIRGAILDELRALDWVPRSTRARTRKIDTARTNLSNLTGCEPSEEELAKYLNCTPRQLFLDIGYLHASNVLSLDEVLYNVDDYHNVLRIETIKEDFVLDGLANVEKSELIAFLIVFINRLSEQESLVISLYHFEELTLKEIGEVMSLSESRVSQVHGKAVEKLRQMMEEHLTLVE